MKKILIFILIALIIILGIYVLTPNETPKIENTKVTENKSKLIEDKTIDNILISNISLVSKNKKTIFSAKITNLTSGEQNYKNLQIIIKDKNKKTIATLISYFGDKLNPEETKIVTAEANTNIKEAKTIEFKLNE